MPTAYPMDQYLKFSAELFQESYPDLLAMERVLFDSKIPNLPILAKFICNFSKHSITKHISKFGKICGNFPDLFPNLPFLNSEFFLEFF